MKILYDSEMVYQLVESLKWLLESHTPRKYNITSGMPEAEMRHRGMLVEEDRLSIKNARKVLRMFMAQHDNITDCEIDDEGE